MQTPKKGSSPSTKKERPVPRSSFPVSRIKTIMKSSPDTNTIGVDAVALTSRAAELFVVYLAKQTLKAGKTNTVDYPDLYKVIHGNSMLDFLYDIIPKKITFKDCKQKIEEADRKEKEAIKDIEI
ncbi:chromatin accessibility complex protein 1 [Galendromus occidentalis]|uniref:Chromatin accessibility complex protein 1 n=1 Tax=Galendromus occidentalis TaxID=34638 RepID=A0AAJ6QUN8_9ACAR|nr:chromatin accessibility complex protein 1 [Galendromus occidentalis]